MFVILETCNLGIGPSPDGGVTLKISEIEGLPHIDFAVPVGPEAGAQLMEEMATLMNKPKIFGVTDMPKGAPNA